MDIGKILQDARIAKNVSLDTAAQETNIDATILRPLKIMILLPFPAPCS